MLVNDIESKHLLATPVLTAATPSTAAATPAAPSTTFTVTTSGDAFSAAVDRVVGAYKWCARSPVATNYIILGVLSLVARLYRIGTPDGVVFDEYHFGRFVNNYLDGNYFFDIHPPLGKLTLAFFGYLTGYDSTVCSYANIGDNFSPECKYTNLRVIAALFGAAFPLLIHGIVLGLGASTHAAFFAGAITIFDMLGVTESRLILTDSQLMFYIALSLLVAVQFWKRLESLGDMGLRMSRKETNLWMVGLGLACGAAVSIKWTALVTPFMIAVECGTGVFGFVKRKIPVGTLAKAALVAGLQYTTWFWFHFAMLPLSGDGDAFMPVGFQATLVGNEHYKPDATYPFLTVFPELNQEMLAANARISTPHHWQTRWYQWLYNARGVSYWTLDVGNDRTSAVYLLGNPIVVWGCGAAVIAAVATIAYALKSRASTAALTPKWKKATSRIVFCAVAYALNLLPYIAVSRSAFLYHFMPALMYSQIIAALFLDQVALGRRKNVFRGCVAVAALSFLYFSPWIYALPLSVEGHAARRWLPGWD